MVRVLRAIGLIHDIDVPMLYFCSILINIVMTFDIYNHITFELFLAPRDNIFVAVKGLNQHFSKVLGHIGIKTLVLRQL